MTQHPPDAPTPPPFNVETMTSQHRELFALGEQVLVGGAVGLFRLPTEVAFVARSGQGVRITDWDGREYLDFMLGYGPLILGHAHPAVVEAVQRRAALGSHFYLINEEAIRLAQLVLQAAPGAQQVRFVGTGSEATFYALRLARAFTQRSKVLRFDGSFHGTHDYSAPYTAGVPKSIRGELVVAPFNDLETTAKLIAAHAGELAAVVMEPMQRCIVPRPEFIQGLRDLTRQHDVLLVLDEVITGFRLAFGGAQERYGVQADLTAYGKIVGGGYPLAAIAGREEIMRLCDVRRARDPKFAMVGGTLSGNPLTAAAGLATLAELQRPGTYARLEALGRRLRSGLEEIGARRGLPLRTAGENTVFQPLITEVEPVDARTLNQADQARTTRFGNEMVKRGVILLRTVFLATTHTEADLDHALDVADEVARLLTS